MKRVFINGCFDSFHEGHAHLISNAVKYGEELVIAMNSDHSITQLKGLGRPLCPKHKRIEHINNYMRSRHSSIIWYIVMFEDEAELARLVEEWRPDMMVKSSEYKMSPVTGTRELFANKGGLVFLNRWPGVSTTHQAQEIDMSECIITDKELKQRLQTDRPAPTVTKEAIESRIKTKFFRRGIDMGAPTLTICNIVLDNGFTVRGESACVNAENYDQKIGEKLAYDDAFKKLWPLFGLLLAEQQYSGTGVDIRAEAGDFGYAINALKSGHRLARKSWVEKGMWLSLSPGAMQCPAEKLWSKHNREFAEENGGFVDVLPAITFKSCKGQIIMGWTPSQTDLLANDWQIILSAYKPTEKDKL